MCPSIAFTGTPLNYINNTYEGGKKRREDDEKSSGRKDSNWESGKIPVGA